VRHTTRIITLALAALVLFAVPVYATDAPVQDPVLPEIVGGTEVAPGDYPFMAALVWRGVSNAKSGLRCGATMLDAEWFLTAAHCTETFDPEDFDIVIGRDVLSTAVGERIAVAEIHEHPGWNTFTFENDIALLKLDTLATVGEPIYWATETLEDWFAPGVIVTAAGWGITENSPGGTGTGVQDAMREVDVPIRRSAECTAAVPSGEFYPALMVCAGYPSGGQDSCSGDSGGPIFVQEADRWRQVGIVSWGYGCADPGDYGYYTRLATYDQWIVDTAGFTACEGAPATMVGTTGDDTLVGTSGHEVIVGADGNDTVKAVYGADIVCGGDGNDFLYSGPDDDLVFGGGGQDRLFGTGGEDILFGGPAKDLIKGGPDGDLVYAGDGDDVVRVHGGDDVVMAGDGADTVYGGSGADLISGGLGDDSLFGVTDDDFLNGDEGNDGVWGQSGDDEVRGGSGDDDLFGGTGTDTLIGGFGVDTCTGGEIGLSGCETIV